jgi:hypothetical protein
MSNVVTRKPAKTKTFMSACAAFNALIGEISQYFDCISLIGSLAAMTFGGEY